MPMYDLVFERYLGKDECHQMILAALYLTEIINATLTTIHIHKEYLSEKEEAQLTTVRQTKLLEKTREVSLLISTMNIYANVPGTDRMARELGEKFAF